MYEAEITRNTLTELLKLYVIYLSCNYLYNYQNTCAYTIRDYRNTKKLFTVKTDLIQKGTEFRSSIDTKKDYRSIT